MPWNNQLIHPFSSLPQRPICNQLVFYLVAALPETMCHCPQVPWFLDRQHHTTCQPLVFSVQQQEIWEVSWCCHLVYKLKCIWNSKQCLSIIIRPNQFLMTFYRHIFITGLWNNGCRLPILSKPVLLWRMTDSCRVTDWLRSYRRRGWKRKERSWR